MAAIYKLINLVGISSESYEDAVKNAVKKAGETLESLAWFEIVEHRGSISNTGEIQFQAVLKLAFEIK
ncbi:MAG: dodecin [Fidelibacterota bacterium]